MDKTLLAQWQNAWGSPRALFIEGEGWRLETALFLALCLHLTPLGYLWHKQGHKPPASLVTLQNVELIEPETEQPPAPLVEVVKPKSALEFLKMALPVFNKPKVEEAPRDIVTKPKTEEPKIAEPVKLMEKSIVPLALAPQIQLNKPLTEAPPQLKELVKLDRSPGHEPLSKEPLLKLEEVGKRAVAVPPTPAISLNQRQSQNALDLASLPKTMVPPSPRTVQEPAKLVDKGAPPVSYKKPTVLGYERQGSSSISLDKPKEAAPVPTQPKIIDTPSKLPSSAAANIVIPKETVKITGPLEKRKVISSQVPQYPDWARAKNIEADVAIKFTVSPSGEVLDNMVVERTSGYPQLDRLALQTLKNWRFSALTNNSEDQWGVITFRFRLD